MQDITWPSIIGPLLLGHPLDAAQSSWAMQKIMQGEATPAQFGAFVAGLRAKGETVEEILGLVTTMRAFSQKVTVPEGLTLVDTCGTGGDRANTINVSTMAAFIAAGAGIKVAKHGNRAASSACGTADLLEELGVKIDLGPTEVAACIVEAGMGFCFAPIYHPSMRHAAMPRRELGVPTVFNFIGPLTNPAGARHQVLGVSDKSMAPKMAEVLLRLGSTHALIVHGSDGLDEITTTAPTYVWELKAGEVTEWTLDTADIGIPRSAPQDLTGGAAPENAKVALHVLSGGEGPARDIAVVNAAAAIVAADVAPTFEDAIEQAKDSLESGRAMAALDHLVEVSNREA